MVPLSSHLLSKLVLFIVVLYSLLVVLLRGFAGYGGHHPSHGLPSVATAGRPCEGWWR